MTVLATGGSLTPQSRGNSKTRLGAHPNVLTDPYGRRHRDLRISLTDRCSLRCTYCMPAAGLPCLPQQSLLTLDEIVRIARVAVGLGVTEIRLTGGEPLLRRDAVEIVRSLASLPHAPEISLTTNGLRLSELAEPLKRAGLARMNVSLDTLNRERYRHLTRRDRLPKVLKGLEAIDAAGFTGTKLNTVLMRDVNDDEVPALVDFALERGYELRFIEQMPLDVDHTWSRESMVTAHEVLLALRDTYSLTPVTGRGTAPAERWFINDTNIAVGVIASVTRPFCGACDRIRVTADGQLRNCLFARAETDLRAMLRAGCTDEAIAETFGRSIADKAPGHGIGSPDFEQPNRSMSEIGG